MSDERDTVTVANAYELRLWQQPGGVLTVEYEGEVFEVEDICALGFDPELFRVTERFCARRAVNYLDAGDLLHYTNANVWFGGDEVD